MLPVWVLLSHWDLNIASLDFPALDISPDYNYSASAIGSFFLTTYRANQMHIIIIIIIILTQKKLANNISLGLPLGIWLVAFI